MMSGFSGLYVATLTPFDSSNRIDVAALRNHARFLIDAGVNGLSPCGTTGEFLYLSIGEKVRVIEETVAAAEGRIPVMAGIWALNSKETALLARAAENGGASAVFLPPPIYYPATDDAIFAWYAQVREAANLPVFAYNIPAYAANAISLECIERLVGEGIISGIKDSTGKAERMTGLVHQFRERITVMAASDAFAAEARKIGAHGFISALANIWPKSLLQIWQGDDSVQSAVSTVRDAVKRAGGIPALRRCLAGRGFSFGASRLPFSALSGEQISTIDAAVGQAVSSGLE